MKQGHSTVLGGPCLLRLRRSTRFLKEVSHAAPNLQEGPFLLGQGLD